MNKTTTISIMVLLFGLLLVVGVTAAWYLAPEFVESQLTALRELAGR